MTTEDIATLIYARTKKPGKRGSHKKRPSA
ncbi:hypothetical protein BVIR_393 [Blastochloris viridis]|uniref:Uncharacterized protein n=1 Tax=Blastochloris viridis TaxID=1079 RepID=A0A0P0IMY9_BLAVI|nr:hypothetical protein BVIR_393 [Blastochloris viridis]CUU44113.1 hypothetical protein BVIRIDIS_31600 [Blastochloris viridis]